MPGETVGECWIPPIVQKNDLERKPCDPHDAFMSMYSAFPLLVAQDNISGVIFQKHTMFTSDAPPAALSACSRMDQAYVCKGLADIRFQRWAAASLCMLLHTAGITTCRRENTDKVLSNTVAGAFCSTVVNFSPNASMPSVDPQRISEASDTATGTRGLTCACTQVPCAWK